MTASPNSSMVMAAQDQRNVALCAAVSLGYFGLAHCSAQRSDLGDLFMGQEFREAQSEVHVDRVLFVHPIINPFEIVGGVIRFNAVDMIDERKVGWVEHECLGDEAMDVDRLAFAVSGQPNLFVSYLVNARSKDFTVASAQSSQWMSVDRETVEASDVSEVADFVESLEISDSAPFFINHQMGPFARSAHSIVLSSTTQGGLPCRLH